MWLSANQAKLKWKYHASGEHTECQCVCVCGASKNLNLISGVWSTGETDEKWPQNVGCIQRNGRFRPNTASACPSVLPIRVRICICVCVRVLHPASLVFVCLALGRWCRHRSRRMTMSLKLWLAAFCGTHFWFRIPLNWLGSHAYLMPAIFGHRCPGISSIFRQVFGSLPAASAAPAPTHMQLEQSRLGTNHRAHKNKNIHNILVHLYTYGRILDAKSFFAGRSARFALKPLCGDAKTSSQVKNYCHSLKWSHLTLAALTPTFWVESHTGAQLRGKGRGRKQWVMDHGLHSALWPDKWAHSIPCPLLACFAAAATERMRNIPSKFRQQSFLQYLRVETCLIGHSFKADHLNLNNKLSPWGPASSY